MTIPALLLLAAAQAAAADLTSAEAALKTQHSEMRTLTEMDCPRSGEGEEIVVCGRRSPDRGGRSGFRVPYVAEPGRRIPGEASSDGGGCMRLCQRPVTIDLFNTGDGGAIGKAVRGIREALED
jgi:hypothetical protein